MKFYLVLCFICSLMRLLHAESLVLKFPELDNEFMAAKIPANYDIDKDPFDELSPEMRADLCNQAMKKQLYTYHESIDELEEYEEIQFVVNYQDLSINNNVPQELNVREEFGIELNGIVDRQIAFKRFFCSSHYESEEDEVIHQQIYLSSGAYEHSAFILARDGADQYLRVYGVLDTNDLVETSEKGTSALIFALMKRSWSVCDLSKKEKFELCSKVDHALSFTEKFAPNVVDTYKDDPKWNVYYWYDQDAKSCHKRNVLIDEVDAKKYKVAYVHTLACVFDGQDVEDADVFISLRETEENIVAVSVMFPKDDRYNEGTSPLVIRGNLLFQLKGKKYWANKGDISEVQPNAS